MSKTRVGLIFDDGFVPSTVTTADLFESLGLRAVFAVLANPAGFAPRCEVGDFDLWNQLQSRGHIIHPHGHTHANLQSMPYPDAIAELARCLQIFSEQLVNFEPARSLYCFAYNASTPALCDWLLERVGAVRTGGSGFLRHEEVDARIWPSRAFGPDGPGTDLMDVLTRARHERPAAVVYCLHGLEGQGWGPIKRDHLRRALETIISDDALEYWPIGASPLTSSEVI